MKTFWYIIFCILLIGCVPQNTVVPSGTEFDIKCEKIEKGIYCKTLEYDFEYLNEKGIYSGQWCYANESDCFYFKGCNTVSNSLSGDLRYLKIRC